MRAQFEQIRGAVSPAILEKVNRLFRNDDAGVWTEMLQNSRRAKSTRVRIQIEETDAGCRITVEDDGLGIENFQSLLTLGASDWSSEVRAAEDPAGMGFFALCHSEVEVHSGSKYVRITPDVFLGKSEAQVIFLAEMIHGTRIRFSRQSGKAALVAALERVAEFCPLEVVLDQQVLRRHDFLEGALFRETIDGIEIGIASEFRWRPGHYNGNWNFHGAQIRHHFTCPHGLVTRDDRGCWLSVAVEARFNVQNTGAVKLQLPDRRAIVEDEGSKASGPRPARLCTGSFSRKSVTFYRSRTGEKHGSSGYSFRKRLLC